MVIYKQLDKSVQCPGEIYRVLKILSDKVTHFQNEKSVKIIGSL
jgi:hypothetical protein